MTFPVYKIEVYDSTPTKLHTITNTAQNIRIKQVATENVGTFSFALPAKLGSSYKYDDVNVGDTVKIWLGYDSISGDPLAVGKIYLISGLLSTNDGYMRVFSGKDQGEVLQRRFKTKRWESTAASEIVVELAYDLGLVTKIGTADSGTTTITVDAERTEPNDYWNGQYIQYLTGPNIGLNRLITDFDAAADSITHNAFPTAVDAGHEYLILPAVNIAEDTTSVTMEVTDKNYWDILKELSDYWVTGGGEITKDFYVDIDGNLVWKDRPLRTSGVEAFISPPTVNAYTVTRDLTQMFNKVTVYGATERPSEEDKDYWTDDKANWMSDAGVIDENADEVIGTWSIECYDDAAHVVEMRTDPGLFSYSAVHPHEYKTFNFSMKVPSGGATLGTVTVELITSTDNYWKTILTPKHHGMTIGGDWKAFSLPIGKQYEGGSYNGEWSATGSPDWGVITRWRFRVAFSGGPDDQTVLVDAVYMGKARFSDTAEDSTSQTNYGIKELVIIDDNLRSDSECEALAEALIDLHKDPALQIELYAPGNTNVLVGDRLSMTLAAEDISSQNFHVFDVEHFLSDQGFVTKVVMNSNTKQRRKIPTTIQDLTVQTAKRSHDALDIRRVKY